MFAKLGKGREPVSGIIVTESDFLLVDPKKLIRSGKDLSQPPSENDLFVAEE